MSRIWLVCSCHSAFETGRQFEIHGPFGHNGIGRVELRSSDVLQTKMDLHASVPAPTLFMQPFESSTDK